MLDVTFIVPYFHPVRGGTENNCLHMALETQKRGHTVRILTSDRKAGKVFTPKIDTYQGIEIIRLRRRFFSQYYLTFWPGLPWRLLKLKTDIIHTSIPGIAWTDFSLIVKKVFSRQTIFINTPHDPFMSRNKYENWENTLRAIFLPFFRLYYNWLYNYVVADNTNQHIWLIKDYHVRPEKIIYVLNGIDEELLEPIAIDPQLIKQYDLEGKVVISMVARYHEYKGYQKVLEALTKIKNKKQLNIKFVGMGEDSGMLGRLRTQIREHGLEEYVVLLENPNDNVRDQILQLSDIFVLASRVEAFGIVILEAMAKGNAIITTRTEGGEFLIKPESGYLYDFEDTYTLASYIGELAADPSKREQMKAYNYEFAKKFLWKKTFTPYAQLLDKLDKAMRPKRDGRDSNP